MASDVVKLTAAQRDVFLKRFHNAVASRKASHTGLVAKVRGIELTEQAKALYAELKEK